MDHYPMGGPAKNSRFRFSLRVFLILVAAIGVAGGMWGRRYIEDFTTERREYRIAVSQDRPRGYVVLTVGRKWIVGGSRQLEFLVIIPERSGVSIEGGDSSFSPDHDGIDIFGRKLFLDGERVIVDPNRPILVLSDRDRKCLAFPAPAGMAVAALEPDMFELTTSALWKEEIQPAIEVEERYNREHGSNSPPRKRVDGAEKERSDVGAD